jgi:hypothetical protein
LGEPRVGEIEEEIILFVLRCFLGVSKCIILTPPMISYEKTNDPYWKYILIQDASFEISYTGPTVECYNKDGRLIAIFTRNNVAIKRGYEWDGATGGIDFSRALPATLVHDLGCQFQSVPKFVTHCANRKKVDSWFREIMIRDGFSLWRVYFYATRLYSSLIAPFARERHAKIHAGLSIVFQ